MHKTHFVCIFDSTTPAVSGKFLPALTGYQSGPFAGVGVGVTESSACIHSHHLYVAAGYLHLLCESWGNIEIKIIKK